MSGKHQKKRKPRSNVASPKAELTPIKNHTLVEKGTPVDFKVLAGLFLLALVPRLIHLIEVEFSPLAGFMSLDTETHHLLASRIAETGGTGEGVFFRAPGYPYYLGMLYSLFGPGTLAPSIIQAIIGALSAPLTFMLGLRLFERRVAFFAAIVVCFYWPLIYFGNELLITIFLVPLDLLILLFLTWHRPQRPPSVRLCLTAGLLVGISALARPNILIFFPAALAWLVWSLYRAKARPLKLKGVLSATVMVPALALTLGIALVVAPVTIRNFVKGDDWVLISSQGGINFYLGNNPKASGLSARAPLDRGEISSEEREQYKSNTWSKDDVWLASMIAAERETGKSDLKPSEISNFWYGRSFDFIISQPGTFGRLLLHKAYYLFNAYEIPSNKDTTHYIRYGKLRTLQVLSINATEHFPFGLVAPLALLGISFTLGRWRKYLLFYLFIGTYSIGILLFFVNARYRIPMVPLLVLFAVHGVGELWRRWQTRGDGTGLGRFVTPLLATLVLLFISNSNWAGIRNRDVLGTLQYNLGNYFFSQGNEKEATVAFEQAIKWNPMFPAAHTNLGHLYFKQQRMSDAASHYREALRFDQSTSDVWFKLGNACYSLDQLEDARSAFERVISLDVNNAQAHANLGISWQRLHNLEKAFHHLSVATSLNPDHKQAHFRLASIHFERGNLTGAAQELKEVLRIDPGNLKAKGNLNKLQNMEHETPNTSP